MNQSFTKKYRAAEYEESASFWLLGTQHYTSILNDVTMLKELLYRRISLYARAIMFSKSHEDHVAHSNDN